MASRRGHRWVDAARTPVGCAAAVTLVAVLLLAVLAPIVWEHQAAAVDTDAIAQGPSGAHPLGTDDLGRDILFRVLVATRLSIALTAAASAISIVIGLVLGAAPVVLGRRLGRLVTAGVNTAVAFPGLLLALFFAVIFGVGARGAVLALGIAGAPSFARLTQTLAAGVAGRDYVAAARVVGVSRMRILVRHVLPNIGEPLAVNATLGASYTLLAFAGLSFLGIGVQPPAYDWGRLLGEGLSGIYVNPMAALAPGIAVVLSALAFNLFGESAAQVIGYRTPTRRPVRAPVDVSVPDADDRAGQDGTDHVLVVENLRVRFPVDGRWLTPVRGVTFSVAPGESVGMVGESGSGKSLTALGAARLLPAGGVAEADRLEFAGIDLLHASERELRPLLGTSLPMVFQDPASSFNPGIRMGRQLAEVAEEHLGASRRDALRTAVDRLRAVRIPAAERRARQYPHEFSGGMRQRAMIGMGLMGSPRLLIADEPTTALDVTVQRQVLELLEDVRTETGTALLMISHDIAVISQVCDRVLVLYAGRIVEDLPVDDLVACPRHPYTRALVAAVPDLDTETERPLATIPGQPPGPDQLAGGCAFAPRCPYADETCHRDDPALVRVAPRHRLACWHPQHAPLQAQPERSRV